MDSHRRTSCRGWLSGSFAGMGERARRGNGLRCARRARSRFARSSLCAQQSSCGVERVSRRSPRPAYPVTVASPEPANSFSANTQRDNSGNGPHGQNQQRSPIRMRPHRRPKQDLREHRRGSAVVWDHLRGKRKRSSPLGHGLVCGPTNSRQQPAHRRRGGTMANSLRDLESCDPGQLSRERASRRSHNWIVDSNQQRWFHHLGKRLPHPAGDRDAESGSDRQYRPQRIHQPTGAGEQPRATYQHQPNALQRPWRLATGGMQPAPTASAATIPASPRLSSLTSPAAPTAGTAVPALNNSTPRTIHATAGNLGVPDTNPAAQRVAQALTHRANLD